MDNNTDERLQLKKTIRNPFIINQLKKISFETGVSPQNVLYNLAVDKIREINGLPANNFKKQK